MKQGRINMYITSSSISYNSCTLLCYYSKTYQHIY